MFTYIFTLLKKIFRRLGWPLFLFGAMVLGHDLLSWFEIGFYSPTTAQEYWTLIDEPKFLEITGKMMKEKEDIWPVVDGLLQAPLFVISGVLGVVFVRLGRTALVPPPPGLKGWFYFWR